jgi:signal transduction histidine kinase
MGNEVWNILLVEDDEDDYFLVKTWLSQVKRGQFSLQWASSYEAALQAVAAGNFDVALVDYQLGSRSGLDLIREAIALCQYVPFILLTGRGNYEVDLTAMEAGAADYLSKAELTAPLLERSIRYAIEQKRAERDMRRAYEKVESLVDERTEELIKTRRKLIDSVDHERRRLAQEIHDGPIQDLLGITYLMIGKAGAASQEELLLSLQGAIGQVVDSLRDVCKELRNSSLAPFNLEESIRSHAGDFQHTHPELELSISGLASLESFSERSRLALYRIYQQAMANIAFHARASRVKVGLHEERGQAVLEVQDDGGGFIVPACLSDLALRGHFGLVGASERATAVGGELQIESKPGRGTLIRAVVPAKIKMAQDVKREA